MIKITCDGGQIGRFWWENSSESGLFAQGHQPCTTLRPGRFGWDHAWPDRHAWPVSPWGKGDPQDDCWRDYAAFEKWFTDECERREIDLDIDITERVRIYALLYDIFDAGVLAGRDPWRWAEELQRITPPQES